MAEKAGKVVYGILLSWPEDGVVEVESPQAGPDTVVTLLGYEGPLHYEVTNRANMVISLPDISNTTLKWSWVLKFTNLQNGGNSI